MVVLRPKPSKALLNLIGSIAFVAVGSGFVWIGFGDPLAVSVGLISMAFFGFAGFLWLKALLKQITLFIDDDGVVLASGWRPSQQIAWSDVNAVIRAGPFTGVETATGKEIWFPELDRPTSEVFALLKRRRRAWGVRRGQIG